MIIHDVRQGSDEWFRVRAGIPTASAFDNIVTPKGKLSTSAERYRNELLAERLMGHPIQGWSGTWMDRGQNLEAEAVSYYEGIRELDTTRIGFLTNDSRTIGASPDRFVGDEGLLEIKVPKEHTHVHYLISRAIDAAYYPQVQGQLWVSERRWADLLSYHPEMPPVIIRVHRDEPYIATLAEAVTAFSAELEEIAAQFKARGWIPDESRANEIAKLMKAARAAHAASSPAPEMG